MVLDFFNSDRRNLFNIQASYIYKGIKLKGWTMRKIILIAIALIYLVGCGMSYM